MKETEAALLTDEVLPAYLRPRLFAHLCVFAKEEGARE